MPEVGLLIFRDVVLQALLPPEHLFLAGWYSDAVPIIDNLDYLDTMEFSNP